MTLKSDFFALKMRLLRRGSASFSRELERSQGLSPEELAQLNLRRRRELVRFAFSEIPHYRQKYSDAGLELGDLEREGFFGHLPILEKEEVRRFPDRMLAPGCRFENLVESTTGGTTGEPLRTYRDPVPPLNISSWRTLRWWGLDVSDNSGYFVREVPGRLGSLARRAALWPTNRNWLSVAEMTESSMEGFHRSLQRNRAAYLVGYVGAINLFAHFLSVSGRRIDSLRAVWTTSAPLTAGHRRFSQRVFDCPVYTQYGSCEFYWIAAECGQRAGLHVASDIRHVEAVDGGATVADGEWGDLVVTDLIDRKFPLIRYRIGDRGRLLGRPCSCSLPFPLMDYVNGRTVDSILTPSGHRIPGEYWTPIFDAYVDQVRSFQVHQAEDLAITVRYEPNHGADCVEVVAAVREQLLRKLGAEASLSFVEAPVSSDHSGKPRFVVSDVVGW